MSRGSASRNVHGKHAKVGRFGKPYLPTGKERSCTAGKRHQRMDPAASGRLRGTRNWRHTEREALYAGSWPWDLGRPSSSPHCRGLLHYVPIPLHGRSLASHPRRPGRRTERFGRFQLLHRRLNGQPGVASVDVDLDRATVFADDTEPPFPTPEQR